MAVLGSVPGPPPSVELPRYDSQGELIYTFHGTENRTIVPLEQISSNLKQAVVAAEDRSFYTHPGVSIKGIVRAALSNVQAGEVVVVVAGVTDSTESGGVVVVRPVVVAGRRRAATAAELGISHMRVARVWAKAGLQPSRRRHYMASDDPDFEKKAADVIGLYLKPPANAVVFCVDEKTAIQALDRLDPVLPLSPGRAERHRCAVDVDRPLVGPLHAVEDLHQGGLARAVLADERMNLSRRVPVLIAPEEVDVDVFACTHNHQDHTDPETHGQEVVVEGAPFPEVDRRQCRPPHHLGQRRRRPPT